LKCVIKQLKNVYRQNKTHQDEIRKLKAELQPFREEVAKRNLDMMAKVATRRISEQKDKDKGSSKTNIIFV
jgi:hypothetical protein